MTSKIRHKEQLTDLEWGDSGHIGTANKLAGFGASGEAIYVDISKIEPPLVAEYQDFVAGIAKDYVLLLSAIYAFTINSFWAEVDDGTIDVSLKIGSTTITGIDGVTIDTTASQIDSTALNSVAVGNRVIFSLSTTFTGTPTLIRIQIKTTRI